MKIKIYKGNNYYKEKRTFISEIESSYKMLPAFVRNNFCSKRIIASVLNKGKIESNTLNKLFDSIYEIFRNNLSARKEIISDINNRISQEREIQINLLEENKNRELEKLNIKKQNAISADELEEIKLKVKNIGEEFLLSKLKIDNNIKKFAKALMFILKDKKIVKLVKDEIILRLAQDVLFQLTPVKILKDAYWQAYEGHLDDCKDEGYKNFNKKWNALLGKEEMNNDTLLDKCLTEVFSFEYVKSNKNYIYCKFPSLMIRTVEMWNACPLNSECSPETDMKEFFRHIFNDISSDNEPESILKMYFIEQKFYSDVYIRSSIMNDDSDNQIVNKAINSIPYVLCRKWIYDQCIKNKENFLLGDSWICLNQILVYCFSYFAPLLEIIYKYHIIQMIKSKFELNDELYTVLSEGQIRMKLLEKEYYNYEYDILEEIELFKHFTKECWKINQKKKYNTKKKNKEDEIYKKLMSGNIYYFLLTEMKQLISDKKEKTESDLRIEKLYHELQDGALLNEPVNENELIQKIYSYSVAYNFHNILFRLLMIFYEESEKTDYKTPIGSVLIKIAKMMSYELSKHEHFLCNSLPVSKSGQIYMLNIICTNYIKNNITAFKEYCNIEMGNLREISKVYKGKIKIGDSYQQVIFNPEFTKIPTYQRAIIDTLINL